MAETPIPDREALLALVRYRMPFGRFKGRALIDLPEGYLVWLKNQGFPQGRLGELLATAYEVKRNGLEYLLRPLRGRE